jgi:hypothetical protein
MIFPTIHLNGTNPQDLLEDQLHMIDKLRDAIRAMEHNGPNGRDYYPQGSQAFQHAVEEHEQRLLVLRNVLAELETIAEHVAKHV